MRKTAGENVTKQATGNTHTHTLKDIQLAHKRLNLLHAKMKIKRGRGIVRQVRNCVCKPHGKNGFTLFLYSGPFPYLCLLLKLNKNAKRKWHKSRKLQNEKRTSFSVYKVSGSFIIYYLLQEALQARSCKAIVKSCTCSSRENG